MSVSIRNLILEVLPFINPKISKPLVTSSFVSALILKIMNINVHYFLVAS